jgi:membrane protein implicated in regulation of membrane protease activity
MTAPILWFLLGTAFLGIEVTSMAFVLIFFTVGAWAAAGAAWCGASLEWQIAIFMLGTLLTPAFLRRRLRAVFNGQSQAAVITNDHPLTGKQGIVSRNILPGAIGEICVGGSFWRATADAALDEGMPARVQGCLPEDGLILRVTLAKKE